MKAVHALVEWTIDDNPCVAGLFPTDMTDDQLVEKVTDIIKQRNCNVSECFLDDDLNDMVKSIVSDCEKAFICMGVGYRMQWHIEISM